MHLAGHRQDLLNDGRVLRGDVGRLARIGLQIVQLDLLRTEGGDHPFPVIHAYGLSRTALVELPIQVAMFLLGGVVPHDRGKKAHAIEPRRQRGAGDLGGCGEKVSRITNVLRNDALGSMARPANDHRSANAPS